MQENNQLILSTPETIAASFNLHLTKNRFQEIRNEVDSIEYTEDNIQHIADTLKKLGKLKMVINTKHSEGKAEALKVCQMWDNVKREYTKMVDDIISVPQEKYTKLCQGILERQRKAEEERVRVQAIRNGIDNNVLSFARKISDCKTPAELVSVERLINFEINGKQSETKYQEFLPEAKQRFGALTSLVKDQKKVVKESVELESKLSKAIEANDDETTIALTERKDEINNLFEENQILVQERAINSSINGTLETATEVFPTVKAKRSVWRWEVVSEKEMVKKMPSWVSIQPNDDVIDNFLAAKKAEGITGEEFTVAGVRFFLSKTF